MSRKILAFSVFILIGIGLSATSLSGYVRGSDGQPLPYANVYKKSSTYGVSSNMKGFYFLPLPDGKHTVVFSFVGYEILEIDIEIKAGKPQTRDVVLIEIPVNLNAFDVIAKEDDRAGEIMAKVRDMRKFYLDNVEGYQCNTYLKTSLERELIKVRAKDTLSPNDTIDTPAEDLSSFLKRENINLIESYTETYFKSPTTYKTKVIAFHDYVTKNKNTDHSGGVSVGVEYGDADIAPVQFVAENPYLVYQDISNCDFNFYNNNIEYPALVKKPLLSPLASTGGLNYRFRIEETFVENNRVIYKIKVTPIFKEESLFEGSIYIEDSTWAIRSVDFSIIQAALLYCDEFRIIQNYEWIGDSVTLPNRREFTYSIRDGRYRMLGNTRVNHSEYQVNPLWPPRFFGNEVMIYEVDAFNKDSSYWSSARPIVLQESELQFISRSDSIQNYYTSEAYYHKIDSSFNHINWWWFWATGFGHRNRAKGNEYYIGGVFEQMNIFGIGGYRHKLPGYFNKDFDNGYTLETRGFIDYGFKNKDVKGQLSLGLTYLPLKFVRTSVEVGDFYDQVNDYASIEQVFSRSNYVRTRTFRVAQRMEVVNGLYAELSFTYSDQDPISDLQLEKWSDILFGDLNEPSDFVRYTKSELRLEMKYRIRQKYIIKQNRKIVLGTDYPEFRLLYRKGIPSLFNSEVNFDYIETGIYYAARVSKLGTSSLSVLAGTYLNKRDLRLLEYKYFRGSDRFFFSNPTLSFQLLGPVLSTPNEFLRANYIHHFDGAILNKVPLLNKLQIGLAVGGGTLLIPASDFQHVEAFVGIERAFRIKRQLLRFGVYAVTSENSLEPSDFTLKVGVDFFNSFSNKYSW